jgi:hypothetical protein
MQWDLLAVGGWTVGVVVVQKVAAGWTRMAGEGANRCAARVHVTAAVWRVSWKARRILIVRIDKPRIVFVIILLLVTLQRSQPGGMLSSPLTMQFITLVLIVDIVRLVGMGLGQRRPRSWNHCNTSEGHKQPQSATKGISVPLMHLTTLLRQGEEKPCGSTTMLSLCIQSQVFTPHATLHTLKTQSQAR